MLKPKKGFLAAELNIDKFSSSQWSGILRAMDRYAEHYHEIKSNMNQIKELFQSLTDDELKNAINELRESEETGLVGDVVRGLARRSGEITGGFTTTDFFMSQLNILKEAAFRWCPK